MSIAPMMKVTLAGLRHDKEAVLSKLQESGCLHLIPLNEQPRQKETTPTREAEAALKAWRFLTVVKDRRRPVRNDEGFDVTEFVETVLALKQRLRLCEDRRDFLLQRMETARPWGDVFFPPKAEIAGKLLWFYRLPLKHRACLEALEYPWTVVNTDNQYAYVILLSETEPPKTVLPVERSHLGNKSLSDLEIMLEETEVELEALHAERVAKTRYLSLLQHNLSEAATQAEFRYAAAQTRDEDRFFMLQAWAPEDCLPELERLSDAHGLALTQERPAWHETPPTQLQQPERARAGTDLATGYQVPSYWSWDPTRLLIFSFTVFFAMILADAGYGLLLLATLILFWRKFSPTPRGRAWRGLGFLLAGATVVYGIIVGSYFGLPPTDGSLLASLKFLDVTDFDTMMRLSVLIGAGHLMLAICMSAWVRRRRPTALGKLGWVGIILGGLALWLFGREGASAALGGLCVVVGSGLILFFSSDRPTEKPQDWAWRLLDGLKGLTGVMGAFGDVLSYLRLFALGLASSSLAITFNDLARSVADAAPGLGLLAALLILIIGHLLNLALGLMSGVVHGLRLNYIEFYKWGLPEEGVLYRPFSRKEISE